MQEDFGWAVLDTNAEILYASSMFKEFCRLSTRQSGQSIFDLIPETVGLEFFFEDLSKTGQKTFRLENINRSGQEGGVFYFNLSLAKTGQVDLPVLCFLEDVSESARLKQTNIQQRHEIRLLESLLQKRKTLLSSAILGHSPAIGQVRKLIQKIASIPKATVLLLGESGTGKSLTARVIHYSSGQPQNPFVEINCAAIPESLLESELFGYEKGAFTHAQKSRKGLIEEAHNGTLFLDEIAELPPSLQSKLLGFLESRTFRRLGSNEERKVNVRIITATNRDLPKMVAEKKFREDLYYRLNVVSIHLPALRNMENDTLLLANHFLQVFNAEFKKSVKGLSNEAQTKLLQYHWPGNVRELSNVLERAMIFAEDDFLDDSDLLIPAGQQSGDETPFQIPAEGISLEGVEKNLLLSALKQTSGNKSKAAKLLRLSRDVFRYRLEKYKISYE